MSKPDLEESTSLQRRQNAAILLSTVGALLAGVGLGAMVTSAPLGLKLAALGVGISAHLIGMIGRRRLQLDQCYKLALWEQVGYWTCWAAISILAVYSAAAVI